MSKIDYSLQPFQEATAQQIFRLFCKEGQRRVLLADEVGLGKTIVAKRVIELVAAWHAKNRGLTKREEGSATQRQPNDPFKVVYICSNANIARQNALKLGIDRKDCLAISESRLSMLHLTICQNEQNNPHRDKQLIPITPSTSLQMTSGPGNCPERALIYVVMSHWPFVEKHKRVLYNMLCQVRQIKKEYWKYYTDQYIERINGLPNPEKYYEGMNYDLDEMIDKDSSDLRENLEACFRNDDRFDKKSYCKSFFRDIRKLFARISIKRLKPDLIIMDEFQRFKDLISTQKKTEINMLTESFFDNSNSSDRSPMILLLSATPYKPYSTWEEIEQTGLDESAREFNEVLKFLYHQSADPQQYNDFQKDWQDYSRQLVQLKTGNWSVLISAKKKAEEGLQKTICRTERRDDSMLDTTSHVNKIPISPDDIASYLNMRKIVDYMRDNKPELNVDAGSLLEWVKSAPYLMSFMRYKLAALLKDYYSYHTRKNNGLLRAETLFLRQRAVNRYQKIPFGNARLESLAAHMFPKDKQPELLLWVPASKPYYKINNQPDSRAKKLNEKRFPAGKIFQNNKDFSKLLVFSSWEMVPRMIAGFVSYEAERRMFTVLNSWMARQSKHKYSYYSVTNDDSVTNNDTERRGRLDSPRLKDNSAKLLTTPSTFLANLYQPERFKKKDLPTILTELEQIISNRLAEISKRLNLTRSSSGARKTDTTNAEKSKRLKDYCSLLSIMDKDSCRASSRKENSINQGDEDVDPDLSVPSDAASVFALAALGSPAVCLYRILQKEQNEQKAQKEEKTNDDEAIFSVKRMAQSFVTLFNKPESQAVIDTIFCKASKSARAPYYKNVLRYCVEGNLQAVLDEYRFLCGSFSTFADNLSVPVNKKKQKTNSSNVIIKTAPVDYETLETFLNLESAQNTKRKKPTFRTHFAAGFYENRNSDASFARGEVVRIAFNSPFKPFVLATTSIGQEGLDFHGYCRNIMHWNLPYNPIDIEQREGRINRYLCHAIRLALANSSEAKGVSLNDFWPKLLEKAAAKTTTANQTGLAPYWICPDQMVDKYRIKRIVPLYPLSRDWEKYERIKQILALYRLTLGQPRQEELLESIQQTGIEPETLQELFFNLSPIETGANK